MGGAASNLVFDEGFFNVPMGILAFSLMFIVAHFNIHGASRVAIKDKPAEKGLLYATVLFTWATYWFLVMLPQYQRLAFWIGFAFFGTAFFLKMTAVNQLYKKKPHGKPLTEGEENCARGIYGLSILLFLGGFGAFIAQLFFRGLEHDGSPDEIITKGVCVGHPIDGPPIICPGYAFLIVGLSAAIVNVAFDIVYLIVRWRKTTSS